MLYLYFIAAMIREWEITSNVDVECYVHVILSIIFCYMEAT